MMQDRDTSNWETKNKRSSGIFSVLKWFRGTETSPPSSPTPPSPPVSLKSSTGSSGSLESVLSVDTVASFSFVPASAYKPFGGASVPEKLILPGPETATYRARLAQRDARRIADKHLTLRSKYNLHRVLEAERRGRSLPLMTRTEATPTPGSSTVGSHRRAISDGGATQRHLHVKGKRKAPAPPSLCVRQDGSLRRRKRMAPQPPNGSDVICNDSLKLDHGILRSAKENVAALLAATSVTTETTNSVHVTHVTPRPWYKRTLAKKTESTEKRRSGLLFLTNISELDREAVQIIEKERAKSRNIEISAQPPAFMRPKLEQGTSDSWISPKRRSARDLIAKFNAITGVSRNSVMNLGRDRRSPSTSQESTPPPVLVEELHFPEIKSEEPNKKVDVITPTSSADTPANNSEVPPNSPVARTAVVKPISRSQWYCPRCTLENDYWRIICRVCSTIKPYFDDFTTSSGSQIEKKEENNALRSTEQQRTVFNAVYPRINLDSYRTEGQKDGMLTETTFKETRSVLKPQYPRIAVNLDKYFGKLDEKREEVKEKPSGTGGHILDEILNEMKKKDMKDNAKKVERMILGDELSFQNPESNKKLSTITTVSGQAKITKMNFGDEIKVKKPEEDSTLNSGYEPIEINSTETKTTHYNPTSNSVVEKMILGDEISVQRGNEFKNEHHQKFEEIGISKLTAEALRRIDEEKRNSAKKEERDKLKKMLIEMKNSLPKRIINESKELKQRASIIQEQQEETQDEVKAKEEPTKNDDIQSEEQPDEKLEEIEDSENTTFEVIVATSETVYENVKMKRTHHPKPLKVSCSSQTNSVLKRTQIEPIKPVNSGFQLMGAKDFAGITIGTNGDGSSHTYANVKTVEKTMPNNFLERSNTDTLEINRLLKRLEMAIANGELGQASVFARELAQMKVPCSVIRQKSEERQLGSKESTIIDVDMFVEDKVSHRGPFPLKITSSMTVAELKAHVEDRYKIPAGVQRWILGKQLATDDNVTLVKHDVATSGCPIFLYLVAPENDEKTDVKTTRIEEILNIPATIVNGPKTEEVEEPQPIIEEVDDEPDNQDLWKCDACTLLNPIVTEECEVCGNKRDPADEKEPDNRTYLQLVDLDNEDLVRNTEGFECLVCLSECSPGGGVTLRECLHQFCRVCLAHTVEFSEEAEVKCPYRDHQYACDLALQDREIKALVTPVAYEQHLAKSVKLAENKINNAFHCKTPDCTGWCVFEDNVNDFYCPVCHKNNCLTCQAIHIRMNCKQYQEQMKLQSETDIEARRTRDMLEEMVKNGEALACPTCQVVLMKKWGCDWLRCSMCKTEICWVTRGPRWGPGGKGDTSAGCKCGVNGVKCHPKCNYCH